MVDARDLKSLGRKAVRVQVPPSAPFDLNNCFQMLKRTSELNSVANLGQNFVEDCLKTKSPGKTSA